jgi:hypothetical protein
MLVLVDNSAPRGIATLLKGHSVKESRSLAWDEPRNGDLFDAAETAGFEVFVTADKNIRYQQNHSERKIAIIASVKGRWYLIELIATIVAALEAAKPGTFVENRIPDR